MKTGNLLRNIQVLILNQNSNLQHTFSCNRVLIYIHFFPCPQLTFYHTIGLFNSPKLFIHKRIYLFILQCLQHE